MSTVRRIGQRVSAQCTVCGDQLEASYSDGDAQFRVTVVTRHGMHMDETRMIHASERRVCVISLNGVVVHHCEELPPELSESTEVGRVL